MFYKKSRIFRKIAIIKGVWYSAVIDRQEGTPKSPEKDPCIAGHLIYDKGGIAEKWEKASIFNKWTGSTRHTWGEKEEKLDPYLTPCTKMNSRRS